MVVVETEEVTQSMASSLNKRWPETGSPLSSQLFIAVVELISRRIVTKDFLQKQLYADDQAVVWMGADNQE